ncbi:low molecular weight protein-tyrosine-phosphatase [Haloferula sargassicola]|uniref:Low molecular weight protein-tyrosine-phosphatase slr0328 n=1 Tax=Haloferula sargassicola TaxID=490096 RepID=A0ABP9UQH7_9BACT
MSTPPVRVLFVCMGNICRSPAAEIVFSQLVHEAGLADRIEVDSAGTIGYHAGHGPDRRMAATLKSRGYAIHGSARQLQARDLQRFDHILVADRENLADARALDSGGDFHSKIQLLTDFCTETEADHVPDPYYGGQRGFERVADIVEDACAGLLAAIQRNG